MATIKFKFIKKSTYIKAIANDKLFIIKFDEFKSKAKEIVDFLNMKQTDDVYVTSSIVGKRNKWKGNSEPQAFLEETFNQLLRVGSMKRSTHITWGDVIRQREVEQNLIGDDFLDALRKDKELTK